MKQLNYATMTPAEIEKLTAQLKTHRAMLEMVQAGEAALEDVVDATLLLLGAGLLAPWVDDNGDLICCEPIGFGPLIAALPDDMADVVTQAVVSKAETKAKARAN